MLNTFFQWIPLPANVLQGAYDSKLAVLSYLVAVFASYIALDLVGRLRDRNNTEASSLLWLLGGSIAMGCGIWAMHFIGMLSFTIPGLTLQYDPFWTVLSLVVAILASGFALYLLKASVMNVVHLVAGGVVLGLAIASMHYTGMAGMLISLNIRYLPTLFFLSIVIAIVASEAAIWLALKSNAVVMRLRHRIKLVSAVIMGMAICGMHYTGMAASVFTSLCATATVSSSDQSFNPTMLAIIIAAVTFVILSIAFFASSYKESINQQQFEQARQLGMAEISASVLHNVGNVLNSVNVSAEAISEKITSSQLTGLDKLSTLLNEHKHDLGNFFSQDPRGPKALEFLNKLTEYAQIERRHITEEINDLLKNVMLIKEIISTQQNLSKAIGTEQVLSINELLEEAILITGMGIKKDIAMEKNYGKFGYIKSDKVKLLQVFVNLIRNAKDAVMESDNTHKLICVTSALIDKNKIVISVSDNGVGIAENNLNRIFNYGFTTKQTGHGFGLHSSALAINELGGRMYATSEGVGKGSTFFIEIPYHPAK